MDATSDIAAGRPPALSSDENRSGPSRVEAARAFEGYMLRLLLQQMRKTVGDGGLFEGQGARSYDYLFDEALSDRAGERGAFGLAEQLLRQWETLAPESGDKR